MWLAFLVAMVRTKMAAGAVNAAIRVVTVEAVTEEGKETEEKTQQVTHHSIFITMVARALISLIVHCLVG